MTKNEAARAELSETLESLRMVIKTQIDRKKREREMERIQGPSTKIVQLEGGAGSIDRESAHVEQRGYLARMAMQFRARLERSRLYSIFQTVFQTLHAVRVISHAFTATPSQAVECCHELTRLSTKA